MSKILKELGKRLAEGEGIQPLRPGQRRPDGYYFGNRETGRCRSPRGAVLNVQPAANETVAADRRD